MLPAIRVENLSKRYRIGHASQRASYRTLRESLMEGASSLFRRRDRDGSNSRTEEFWALKGIDFEVQPGEIVGVIGRNGAGKSTLLKILSRITEPTEGRVRLRGRVGSLLEVGTGFHPELSGRENIYLNGAILGMTRREIGLKFDEIVAFSEIDRFLDTPVKRYSSGMYVRLAFAVAAHLEPEILLVDEVLAVGDASFQKKCLGKLGSLSLQERTVLFVSHNLAALQQLCTTGLLIASGQVVAHGSVDQVVTEYLGDATENRDGVFDLSIHPARAKYHKNIIKSLILSPGPTSPSTSFFPDSPFHAQIHLEPHSPITEPRVALAIEDAFGRRITTVASYFNSEVLGNIDGPCDISCIIPELRLGSGRYLVSVSISDNYSGLLDSLDCVAWFDVGWANNYENGELHLPVYGPVLSRSAWNRVN